MTQQVISPSPQEVESLFDSKSGFVPAQLGGQLVRRSKRVFKGVYDFSVQGGAVGAHNLYDPMLGENAPLILPPSFIISNVSIDTLTALTSGGAATVALTSGVGAGDLKAAAGFAGYVGVIAGIPVSAATSVKVPAATVEPGVVAQMVIAVAALTAGKFNVHIEGFLSD